MSDQFSHPYKTTGKILHVALTRTNGRNLGTFQKAMLSRKTISSSKIPFFLKRLMQASFRDLRAGIAQAQPADYRGVDKSLARPGRKQAQKHVRDARDFNNIETQAVIKFFFFLQGKAPKEFHAILTETLACFLPGRSKDLSAPLYIPFYTASYCNRFTARKYH